MKKILILNILRFQRNGLRIWPCKDIFISLDGQLESSSFMNKKKFSPSGDSLKDLSDSVREDLNSSCASADCRGKGLCLQFGYQRFPCNDNSSESHVERQQKFWFSICFSTIMLEGASSREKEIRSSNIEYINWILNLNSLFVLVKYFKMYVRNIYIQIFTLGGLTPIGLSGQNYLKKW